jgi:hypothetical protein
MSPLNPQFTPPDQPANPPPTDQPAPQPSQARPKRFGIGHRHGRGNHYTEAERQGAYRHFEAKGRRCDGADRGCPRQATREMVVVEVDIDTGEVIGEPTTVKACANHRKSWTKINPAKPRRYNILGFKMLAGTPDPDTGLMISGCYLTQQ